ncbi:MAG: FAD:protein FMN transferase [Solirubrobacterales bacterium]|nr:FAD:protein FMN transferase [Solirubrobacterales bacterium]
MSATRSRPVAEAIERFECFGGACSVLVAGPGPAGTALQAAARARRRMLEWHAQFSRFDPRSELSRLNADRHEVVPVSGIMARFVQAALEAASITGGLLDPTLVAELERAGYAEHFGARSVPLAYALRRAPRRSPAGPRGDGRWRTVAVDPLASTVTRPVGVRLDSGGVAKGLFGDVLASVLGGHAAYAVNAAGDVRFGGAAGLLRPVQVSSPFDDSVLHTFAGVHGAAATSGIGRRSWLNADGRPAHHLLDPASGRPAYTGVVQVTARARSGVLAEARAKAALLSGPERAREWLAHDGGLVVYETGEHELVQAGALACQ